MREWRAFGDGRAVSRAPSAVLARTRARTRSQETESAVIDGYPMHFEVDRNGKQREWEATSLIPFLDEETLQASAKAIDNGLLSPTEAKRNSHGIETVFTPLGVAPADVPGPKAQSPTPRPRTAKPRVVKGMQA